jgi:hypothetical protein
MKIKLPKSFCPGLCARLGFLELDLAFGITILAVAIIPLGFSFARERDVLRAEYFRGVAVEIVDGETEILAAGDWKNFPDGTQNYTVRSRAATSLPPGHFELIKTGNHLRLEWTPDKHKGIGVVVREINVK